MTRSASERTQSPSVRHANRRGPPSQPPANPPQLSRSQALHVHAVAAVNQPLTPAWDDKQESPAMPDSLLQTALSGSAKVTCLRIGCRFRARSSSDKRAVRGSSPTRKRDTAGDGIGGCRAGAKLLSRLGGR
jgi:hypothetical protein